MPAQTEFFGGVAVKAADVGTDEGDAEHVKVEHVADAGLQVRPVRRDVAGPMRRILALTDEGRTRQDEGTFVGKGLQESVLCRFGLVDTVCGMQIVVQT